MALGTVLLVISISIVISHNKVSARNTCYESTECRGAVVETDLPLRGDCCGGRGLSFSSSSGDGCRNCFSMAEFCNDGSEFYVAFFSNLVVPPLFSQASILVKLTNMEQFQQTVAYSYKSETREIEIGPSSSVEFTLPSEIRFGAVGEMDKGVFIQSVDGARLSATAFGAELFSSDTYQLLPCVYLPSKDYEYYAISVAKERRVVIEEGEEFIQPPSGNSAVVLIASEESTTVTITPSQNVEITKGTTTPAGTSVTLTIGQGKAVFLSSPEDLTGTHVVSDKPLAFFSGHECGNMPFDLQYCDHMVEQISPTATWGTEFYTASFMTRPRDRFRAISSRNNNSLSWFCTGTVNNTDERSLPTAGDFTEFEITANRFCCFTSIHPVLLLQFSIGGAADAVIAADPSMTVIPPAGQYKDSYMLNYFSGLRVTNYVNIILLNTPGITTGGISLINNPINGSWTNILCENDEICAFGIQLQLTETENGAVSLVHSNPDAKLLGISYSTDIRTSRASFSGMTQKPIALDTVSLSGSEYCVEEGGGDVVITINRAGNLLDDISVLFVAGEIPGATGAAIAGEDFTEARREVLLPAGVYSVTQTVALGPDNTIPGEDKVFEVYLGPAPGAFVSPTAQANVTIIDPDSLLPVLPRNFTCYESTECRGAVVETDLPLRGHCCGRRGLSFSYFSGDCCRNCSSSPSPIDVTAVQDGPTSITVTWTPPSPLGNTTGYRISYTGGGISHSVVVSGANNNSYILTELSNGYVYSISVATTTSASFPSLPVQAATVSLVPFTAPVIHSAIANATSINITHSIPSGSVVTRVLVHWQRDSSFDCPDTHEGYNSANNISNVTVTGLEEDSMYNITMIAINDAGSGPASSAITATTREAAPSSPPSSFRRDAITSNSIILQWGEVECLCRNGIITGYTVQVLKNGAVERTVEVGGDILEATVPGLTPSTTYNVQVAAVNSVGTGPFNGTIYFLTEALVVGVERTSFTVSESMGAVEICITAVGTNTPCPSTQSFQVTLSTTDECAVSPSDYEALTEVLTFAPCDTLLCMNVIITDDLVNEPEETFSLSLTKISSFVTLNTTAGEVLITDDDDKPEGVRFLLVNATAVRISWTGSIHLPTSIIYTVYCSTTVVKKNERVYPPGVISADIVLEDDIILTFTSYVHNFTLYYGDAIPSPGNNPSTFTTFTFVKPEGVRFLTVNATAVRISWSGSIHLPTSIIYTVYCSTNVFRQNERVYPPGVTSADVVLEDDIVLTCTSYVHNFTLYYGDVIQLSRNNPSTSTNFTFDKAYLQIQFGPFYYCLNWEFKKVAAIIERELQFYLVEMIHSHCSDCYRLSLSIFRKGVFVCHGNPTKTTYRTTLVNPFPTTNSTHLVGVIQSWVSTGPSLVLDGLLVRVSPACPTSISSLDEDECETGTRHDRGLGDRITQTLNVCAVRNLGEELCSLGGCPLPSG